MNPDDPKWDESKFYREAYARPIEEKEEYWDEKPIRASYAQYRARCISLVGRVITQKGWEGALVLSYSAKDDDRFEVRLASGQVIGAIWNDFSNDADSAGVTSRGWSIIR